MKDVFLNLIRIGIGKPEEIQENIDWTAIKAIAEQQGLSAFVLDGIEKLQGEFLPPKEFLLQWIGEVLQAENVSAVQQKAAIDMSSLFNSNCVRTYVLKGAVIAECYPEPKHRVSVDMDCFLLPVNSVFDAWTLGNDLIRALGYEVSFDYYKNSTFHLPGLVVENHHYFTPFRGNKRLKSLERVLQSLMKEDKGNDRFDDTWLYRPPVMVTALFMIEHAYSHFLHEGLTWKMVLDWMMFSHKHKDEIDWDSFDDYVDEFGFRKFYDSYIKLGRYLVGEISEEELSEQDVLMLGDVWDNLDVHETVYGIKGKLALAGSTWRARWKYRCFSEISMLEALWIQVKGVMLIKEPTLN